MKIVLQTVLLCWYWLGTKERVEANTQWDRFATNELYADLRMLTDLEDYFPPRYIPINVPLMQARYECSSYCATNQTCQAFNFYETNTSYVCELQPDNLCLNKTAKAFAQWPGSFVWDKLTPGMTKTCLEILNPPKQDSCGILRPGCHAANWPRCNNCVQTCIDCAARYTRSDTYNCTLWPDGDSSFGLPIFGRCDGSVTLLIKRVVNIMTKTVEVDYRMSFTNMNRLSMLKKYKALLFFFKSKVADATTEYRARYFNSVIDANGTLTNMTSQPGILLDIFNLNGALPSPAFPFVTVTDDLYGCGSFWLLDPSNATYCPGGKVGMLGKMNLSSPVMKTGIRFPSALAGTVVWYSDVRLTTFVR